TARVDASIGDDLLDGFLGGVAGQVATSSGRLPGDLDARASSAIDGDPATSWTNHLGPQEGSWVEVSSRATTTIDHLDLAVQADGVHSVPTKITVTADGRDSRTVDLPAVVDGTAAGALAHLPASFAPLTGTRF